MRVQVSLLWMGELGVKLLLRVSAHIQWKAGQLSVTYKHSSEHRDDHLSV